MDANVKSRIDAATRFLLKAPVHVYRWTLRPYVGQNCRHLPTCSDYALEAIDKNGAWRGFWLAASRLARCHPWGTAGYDPVPDTRDIRHPWAPWRHGRWSWRSLSRRDPARSATRGETERAKARSATRGGKEKAEPPSGL